MKIKIAIIILCLVSSAYGALLPVAIDDQDSLVVGDSFLAIPLPSEQWDWYIGEERDLKGVKLAQYFCKQEQGEQHFTITLIDAPFEKKEDREKFVTGLIKGLVKPIDEPTQISNTKSSVFGVNANLQLYQGTNGEQSFICLIDKGNYIIISMSGSPSTIKSFQKYLKVTEG